MKKISLALIGAGNVMRTRHMPALKKNKELYDIRGVIDIDEKSAQEFARNNKIPNYGSINKKTDLARFEWFNEIEAVIIGIPPQMHYKVARECLRLGKHVMLEKPFTVRVSEARKLVDLAKRKNLRLAVKHNFQFTRAFLTLSEKIKNRELGNLRSIYCVQLTNQSRRIPKWTEDLPIGLFYDESPHYFYLIKKYLGGNIKILNAFKSSSLVRQQTPQIINLNLKVGRIPVQIYWNFDSPICEWYFSVFGDKKSATVDLFRDILITLPNDSPHLEFQVMRTSVLATLQHWVGVLINGISYLRGELYYGFDKAQENFYHSIIKKDNKYIRGMSGEDGLFVTRIQNQIVKKLNNET